ncbi:hypothetical protein [Actinoplanes sp. NPDC049599]|uniref:hypothetical protein n=1 Tax=Actinoplanes sp. NPDC049599 TaxID=3363903 RepID=UPI0037942974
MRATGFIDAPIFALQEFTFAQGPVAPGWAAERALADHPAFAPDADPLLFTGEMMYPWMFREISALKPFAAAADLLAAHGRGPPLTDVPTSPMRAPAGRRRRSIDRTMDLRWWSIEVLDGATLSAARWQDAHGTALTEAAITHGAYEWRWQHHSWGVLFEIAFRGDESWTVFRELPAVHAALDAVPDPVNGLLVYPGRGGSSGRVQPRRPRPIVGAGAATLPIEPAPLGATLATCHPAAGVTAA